MKKKIIETGECEGLTEVSEDILEQREKKAKASTEIPVKQQLTGIEIEAKLTPEYCLGDLERCPAPCGACVYDKNAPFIEGTRFNYQTVLDTEAYLAQNPRLATSIH